MDIEAFKKFCQADFALSVDKKKKIDHSVLW